MPMSIPLPLDAVFRESGRAFVVYAQCREIREQPTIGIELTKTVPLALTLYGRVALGSRAGFCLGGLNNTSEK